MRQNISNTIPAMNSHEIASAKAKFLQRVSDGISYLIDRHGYSRSRASNLILGEIRRSDPLPSEDEIFSVMEKFKLGVQEATEAIIISKTLRKLQQEEKLSPAQAIDMLTSSLTTMKLLGRVENQIIATNVLSSSNDGIMASATTNSRSLLQWKQTLQSHLDKSGSGTSLTTSLPSSLSSSTSSATSSAKHNLAKKISKPIKNNNRKQRQQETDNVNEGTADSNGGADTKVIEKVISNGTQNQSNIKDSTSSALQARMKPPSPKVTREKRELDSISNPVQTQSVTKRQRLDSI